MEPKTIDETNVRSYITQMHIDLNLLSQLRGCGWQWKFSQPFEGVPLFSCKMVKGDKMAIGYGETLDAAVVEAARLTMTGNGKL